MNTMTPIVTRPQTATDVRPNDAGAPQDAKPERSFWQRAFGDDGVTFSTLLDVINPLQHIPVVSTIYREVTGDTIAPAAKLIGDTLFGGTIGLALSAVDVTVQGETGKDMGEHVVAMFKPNATSDSDTMIASAEAKSSVAASVEPEISLANADASRPAEPTPSPAAAPSDAPKNAPKDEPAETAADPKPTEVASLAPKPSTRAVEPAAYTPRSAFVAAAMKPRAAGNGIGAAFVPLETRSTIAPPSMFAPVSLGVPAPLVDATKSVDKNSTNLPDAKSVAANPDMLRSLRANGARPAPAQNPYRGPSVTLPMPPPTSPPVSSLAAPTDAGDAPNALADTMARNLERYMALRNRRPAPTKVNSAL